jgi:hypothetical protein
MNWPTTSKTGCSWINNATTPPFGTLISDNQTTGARAVVKNILFDLTHTGVDAQNGTEQPVRDPGTQRFQPASLGARLTF